MGLSSIAPSVEPHCGQNARDETFEERQTDGAPPAPVQLTSLFANSTHVNVSPPEWRWHMLHEQVWGLPGTPLASNLMLPQRQPPVRNFSATDCS